MAHKELLVTFPGVPMMMLSVILDPLATSSPLTAYLVSMMKLKLSHHSLRSFHLMVSIMEMIIDLSSN